MLGSFQVANGQQNLVQNSSFEQTGTPHYIHHFGWFFPDPPAPNSMSLVKGDVALIMQDDATAHSGEYSLRISSDEPVRCAVTQSRLPFIPGQRIRLSGWMKGQGLDPRGDMPGGVARLGFSNTKDQEAHQKAYKHSGFLKSPGRDFDWTYFSTEVTVPAEAERMTLDCFLWESCGTIWFDDLSIEVIDGPENPEGTLPDPDGLRRYQKANAALSPAQFGETRVVFYGDSITDNWKLDQYFPTEGFINRGIGGQDTGQMRVRLSQDVLELKPSVVWFLGGTNDIAKGFTNAMIVDNVSYTARKCHEHGIQFIVCSVLPISDYHKDRDARLERSNLRPPARILALNESLKELAAEKGAAYLDLFHEMVDTSGQMPADMSNDGLHPNSQGYRIMAPIVLQSINAEKAKI
jgi:acyl-CoA thioesterase-1